MRQYTVEFYENGSYEEPKEEIVLAKTKEDAWYSFMATHNVYSAWVANYTTQKGDIHYFNTFSGMPY